MDASMATFSLPRRDHRWILPIAAAGVVAVSAPCGSLGFDILELLNVEVSPVTKVFAGFPTAASFDGL